MATWGWVVLGSAVAMLGWIGFARGKIELLGVWPWQRWVGFGHGNVRLGLAVATLGWFNCGSVGLD